MAVPSTKSIYVHGPTEDKIVETQKTNVVPYKQIQYIEKVVERVLLLPQILEVIKNVHHISEEVFLKGLHLVVGVDVQIHTLNYIKICQKLRADLEILIVSLRLLGPSYAVIITAVESLLVMLAQLIQFPTIIEVPKEVVKIVRVPVYDDEFYNMHKMSLILIQKLVAELKRLQSTQHIHIEIDTTIYQLFFSETHLSFDIEALLGMFWKSYPSPSVPAPSQKPSDVG